MHELLRALLALMILTVPAYGGDEPTLGWGVIDWMHDGLVHGPGDIKGRALELDQEKIGFILRFYQINPPGHEYEGRRCYERCGLSLPKGSAKSELGALLALAELHPDAPVRFDGWNADGTPRGRGIHDPFIPVVAYTEKQSAELVYGAARVILLNSKYRDDFEISYEHIIHKSGDGKLVSLASSPGGNDGARTTFQVFDETHRFTTPELIRAWETMLQNTSKRALLSDPWTLEITTAFDPSEKSVARKAMAYAQAIKDGKVKDARLFYFHRQADEDADISTLEGQRKAITQARGPFVSLWTGKAGVDSIAKKLDDPEMDKDFWRRVWLNQILQHSARAFSAKLWANRIRPGYVVAKGAPIVLGFDGSLTRDATALIATEIPTGFQWPINIWERPHGEDGEDWRVPEAEVDAAVADAFERYAVWRMYADPYWWETWVSTWASPQRHGERVVRWPTIQEKKMAAAVRAYSKAMQDPSEDDPEPAAGAPSQILSHNGDKVFARHIENACKRHIGAAGDDEKERPYVIEKDRKDSPNKMDAAAAGGLSWQCRMDAIEDGGWKKKAGIYETRGPLVFGGAKA